VIQEIRSISFSGVNCYLVRVNSGFILIDTGFSKNRFEIEKELESAGCKPGNLKLIFVTHGDSDHVGNCAYLREKYGTSIAMNRGELDAVESGNPVLNKKIGRNFKGIMVRTLLRFYKLKKSDRFRPDVFLEDGNDLQEYGFDARVLHIPGHSNGSIGILTASGDLFCGDLLRNGGKPAPGFGIFDKAGFEASIEKLRYLKVTTVYPGHGKPFPMELFLKNYQIKVKHILRDP
jgi:glyoxylase-like metal-dependent hydrolase (beta-lactamase superfamily II)